jgi:hypothetical protein
MSSVEEPEWLTRVRANDPQLTSVDLGWTGIVREAPHNLAAALGTNTLTFLSSLDCGVDSLAAAKETPRSHPST